MNQKKIIRTEFGYSEEELSDFFKFHLMIKDKSKLIYYLSSLFFIALALLLIFLFHQQLIGFILIISAIILVLSFPLQVKRTIKKMVLSRYKRPKQPIIFTGEKIIQEIDKQKIEYSWDQILEVDETKKYLYLYISKYSALIVNKTTITEEVYQDLIILIKQHIKEIILYKNR